MAITNHEPSRIANHPSYHKMRHHKSRAVAHPSHREPLNARHPAQFTRVALSDQPLSQAVAHHNPSESLYVAISKPQPKFSCAITYHLSWAVTHHEPSTSPHSPLSPPASPPPASERPAPASFCPSTSAAPLAPFYLAPFFRWSRKWIGFGCMLMLVW
jgi:hypothetical protein